MRKDAKKALVTFPAVVDATCVCLSSLNKHDKEAVVDETYANPSMIEKQCELAVLGAQVADDHSGRGLAFACLYSFLFRLSRNNDLIDPVAIGQPTPHWA